MSAPAVSIGRLSATAHLEEGQTEEATRVARLLGQVAAARLDRAFRDAPPPPGIWCVRRLDVAVRLDLDRPDPALEAAWAERLTGALHQALQLGSGEVVRYDHERDALLDLVCGAATGRLGRAWAWRRLGLLQPADPPLDRATGEALVTVLGRHPRQALGAVVAAAGRVGLAALQHALGPAGWTAVADVVREALGVGPARPGRGAGLEAGDRSSRAAALVDASRLADLVRGSRVRLDPRTLDALALLVVAEGDPSVLRRPAGEELVAAVARALAARTPGASTQGTAGHPAPEDGGGQPPPPPDPVDDAPPPGDPTAAGRAAGRPPAPDDPAAAGRAGQARGDPAGRAGEEPGDPAGAGPETLSAARTSDTRPRENPALRRKPPRRGSVADDELARAPLSTARAGPEGEMGRPRSSTTEAEDEMGRPWSSTAGAEGGMGRPWSSTAGAEDGTRAQPAAPEGGPRGRPTDWAGLLFLLATAAGAGIPDTVLDDPVLAARPLPWSLQGIALQLVPVTVQDPAVAAFAGTDPEGPPPWRLGPPAGDDELVRLGLIAHRWAAVTAAALAEPERDPLDVVASVARRGGVIDHAPGWLEVHLDIDQVDVAVRRAGLDLDPGWVPWLGTVVRFVYG